MIIAVVVLVFLVYFLVSIYFTRVQGNDLVQAQEDIDLLNKAIKNVDSSEVILNNPVGWYMFSFIGEVKSPNACAGKNCLCICDKVSGLVDLIPFGEILPFVGSNWERQFNECNTDGACLGVSNLEPFGGFEIEKITKILINKENGKVVISK